MRFIIIISLVFAFITPSFAAISGNIQKSGYGDKNQIIDTQTGNPVGDARVKIPSRGCQTTTDNEGRFELSTKIDAPTIMSVDKQGYKPFSLTVDSETFSKPIVIGIEKTTPHDIIVDTDMYHIGDDNYSENSANASEFKIKAIGPFYTKNFPIKTGNPSEDMYLVIGSIIGIDTKLAKEMRQSNVITAYASPPEVYFNGNKIAEIQLNGDNQQIKIPRNLIRFNGANQVTIKCGKNLFQKAYTDYDDIEFMNLYLESKPK